MKRKLLCFLLVTLCFAVNAQTDYYVALANNNSTSGNGRAPQGSTRYNRSIWLITTAEMTAAGFTNGSVVNSLGFNFATAQNITTTGNIIIYLQNTADATNTKSTAWATAITGMTTVSNASVTLPAAAGAFDIPFSGGSPFTYTGGAIYVAFDYQNAANPVATTPNGALCSTTLANGLKSAFSPTAAPTTIVASNFRPETRLGKSVTCARPTALGFNTPALNSVNLTFNVTGGGTVTLEYGPYGFVQGTGTTVNSITSPYNLSGLTPNSTYEYYVRKDCGAGNLSIWEGPYPFHTIFQSTSPSYNTSFEHVDFPFVGWLAVPNNTANSWFINYGGPASALVQQGESSAVAITPAAAAANERLFSRGINLTAGSTTTITYYVRNYQATTTATANYQLTVGTDQTAASQTTVLATETGVSNTAFVQKTYNFTPPATGTYYFSFLHNSAANATPNSTHALIIDNVTVTEVLSTKDFLFSKIAVYPNPASDFIMISNTSNIEINEVNIVDVNGRTVKLFNPKSDQDVKMNISDLTAGIYFMDINTSEGSATKKIVKQ
ncbi:T9SS type A sorting domain-containing protein [Flavobacterium sp.]|uniref:T9SS type A sorting domain-containing protein n=1 Tax=Flavobacterium sp. TaxID=239 RepID=UPI003D6BE52E